MAVGGGIVGDGVIVGTVVAVGAGDVAVIVDVGTTAGIALGGDSEMVPRSQPETMSNVAARRKIYVCL